MSDEATWELPLPLACVCYIRKSPLSYGLLAHTSDTLPYTCK